MHSSLTTLIAAGALTLGGALVDKDKRRGCYRCDRDGDRYWDLNC